ncbi:hypothetical protein Y032_0537g3110 [Ancylostoma ceylanicum]|uniref:Uncharacterized protein n=1 Tax=Ancylostoma ceylanicum TaxID=53326 RepID=A0A016WTA6_9BILA|nr:hypothetical protein Y032_0537g3110 [Ancylostoma ceylanicum]
MPSEKKNSSVCASVRYYVPYAQQVSALKTSQEVTTAGRFAPAAPAEPLPPVPPQASLRLPRVNVLTPQKFTLY